MKRRLALSAATFGVLAASLGCSIAFGQGTSVLRRIGVLPTSSEANFAVSLQALRDGLRERGHVEGRDIAIDVRYANGQAQELPRLAAELAALRPAVIIAPGETGLAAALAASGTLPVVSIGDLVGSGRAAHTSRPGGRVTGVNILSGPLDAKRLELLATLLPRGSAVLHLADPQARGVTVPLVEQAGRSLGLVTHVAYARTPAEIDMAFTTVRQPRTMGVNVLASPFLAANRRLIYERAASARLPAIYQWPEYAREGGLMAYGPSLGAMFGQLAGFVSRILKGASPAELPVELPTRFELIINLKAARALGLTIPQSLLVRADEVIE